MEMAYMGKFVKVNTTSYNGEESCGTILLNIDGIVSISHNDYHNIYTVYTNAEHHNSNFFYLDLANANIIFGEIGVSL